MKTFFKKLSVLALILSMAIGSFVGCGSGSGKSSSSGGGIKVLCAFHDEGSSYLAAFLDVVAAESSDRNISYDVVYCEKNADKQKEQIEAAAGQYDVIICRLADASTALQMEVAAGDTPMVFINNKPDEEYLKANKYVYVASYEQDSGRYQAEYVWNGLGKPSSVNAIILQGQKGHASVGPRTNAIKYFFWDNNVDLNIVFSDFTDWKGDKAYAKLDVFKNTNQQFDCIFANSDAIALGAVDWLKDNGYDTSKILVAGIDCSEDGCKAVINGDMYMTVLQDTENQAKAALDAVQIVAKGGSISSIEGATEDEKFVWIPFVAVDSSNASQYLP